MDIRRFYTEPDYFFEFFLKYKILCDADEGPLALLRDRRQGGGAGQ
jgi:hypothetical protein